MGTNFYIRGYSGSEDYGNHIGKRCAAGWYCWDCGRTLAIGGEAAVHSGAGRYATCPKCGQKPIKEDLGKSAAGRELGFNKSVPARKTGVRGCASFSWAIKPTELPTRLAAKPRCASCDREFEDAEHVIENQYGDVFTLDEFYAVLDECPIQFTRSVGTMFS